MFLLLFLLLIQLLIKVSCIENPEEFINLLAGTFTDGNKFSTGNTLPLIGMPHGFNHWSPQTIDENPYSGSWWFKGSDHKLTWLRCTHQPSPWIGDWGYFAFSPQLGPLERNPEHFWEPRGAVIKPYLFDATVAPYGIRIELAPTMHGAIFRVTFPSNSLYNNMGGKRICFVSAEYSNGGINSNNNGISSSQVILGKATQVHHDRMLITNFGLYIHIESTEAINIQHEHDMICYQFKNEATTVNVRMATSLISKEQAALNFQRQVPVTKSFEDIYKAAKTTWRDLLKRVDVVDAGPTSSATYKHLTVFYTGLFRALSFPRRIDELDRGGKMVHYSPYDPQGRTHSGPLVTDNGFWDTFRTVYPLLGLLYPDLLGTIIQGWLNAYQEGGWLPSWASPGYRNCMVGTFADVVVSDAIVKNIPGFDLELARQALMKDAFEIPPAFAGNAVGKEGLAEYMSIGYVPIDSGQGSDQISRTLDFGFADYATSQAFTHLATSTTYNSNNQDNNQDKKKDLISKAAILLARSVKGPQKLFESKIGLMVGRSRTGSMSHRNGDFNEVEWGNGYTEGNAWHHSFPPYAIDTLIKLYGSSNMMLMKLKNILTVSGDFDYGSYNQEIHEMVEARALGMGQYSHNNQPCHHILYLFAMLNDRKTTEEMVRVVMDKAYGVDFYAGDEDNGEMGAWFVLSALGLFVTTPGTTDYVLGSPLFKHVRILRPGVDEVKMSAISDTSGSSDSSSSSSSSSDKDSNNSNSNNNNKEKKKKKKSYLHILAPGTKEHVYRVSSVHYHHHHHHDTVAAQQLPSSSEAVTVEIKEPVISHNQLNCLQSITMKNNNKSDASSNANANNDKNTNNNDNNDDDEGDRNCVIYFKMEGDDNKPDVIATLSQAVIAAGLAVDDSHSGTAMDSSVVSAKEFANILQLRTRSSSSSVSKHKNDKMKKDEKRGGGEGSDNNDDDRIAQLSYALQHSQDIQTQLNQRIHNLLLAQVNQQYNSGSAIGNSSSSMITDQMLYMMTLLFILCLLFIFYYYILMMYSGNTTATATSTNSSNYGIIHCLTKLLRKHRNGLFTAPKAESHSV